MTAKPDNPPAFKDYGEAYRYAFAKSGSIYAARKYARKKFPPLTEGTKTDDR